MASKKELDIRNTGPQSYRTLQQFNNDPFENIRPSIISPTAIDVTKTQDVSSPLANTAMPWGESVWDEDNATAAEFERLQDVRAENQPWYLKIGAGVAKALVLGATTFADGIAGTLNGIGSIIARSYDGDIHSLEDVGDAFINNDVSVGLQNLNTLSEDYLPNYYTQAEQNSPWWNNMFTANFIGDKFIKNLGFIIGAAYSGRVYTGLLGKAMGLGKVRNAFKGAVTTASGRSLTSASEIARAYKSGDAFMDGVKLTDDLGRAAKKLRNAEYGLRVTGSVIAAVGEGRIEAITNSRDYYDYHSQLLKDEYDKEKAYVEDLLFQEHPEYFVLTRTENGEVIRELNGAGEYELNRILAPLNEKYEASLAKLNADRAKMANRIFAANVALLSASNLYSYGKFLGGGYKTQKQASRLVTKAEEGLVKNKKYIRGKYVRAATVPFVEMNEEMAQAGIAEATGQKYASELNSFYGAKIDPDAEEETIDWMEAIGKGIANTYGNPDRWEEGFLGFITGGLGMPHISMRRTESGKKRPKLTIEGELWEGIREARKLNREANNITEAMNARLKDPEFRNYYQGMIRHNKYQNDMNAALARGDEFSFKNAESSQWVSDAIMFDKAGRLQDLYDTIEEAGNVTLDDVEEIRRQTTKKDGEASIYDSMSDQEVVDHIRKQATEAKQKLDKYVEISNNLKTLYGDNIASDTLEELTWTMTQIDDWEERTKSIMNDIRTTIEDKVKIINDRFGIDISAELGNLGTMLNQVGATDNNIIDQINKIINNKNLTLEEGRKRIEELIKAKEIERNTSGLKLGREIQHIRKIARLRREALNKKLKEEDKTENTRHLNREAQDKEYQAYLQELNRLTDELNDRINRGSKEEQKNADVINQRHYSLVGITESMRQEMIDIFEAYYKRTRSLDESLKYAEDTLLNRMAVEMSKYEGERGKSAFERSREAFARNRQRANSETLFSQLVALKEMLETDDYKTIDPLDTKKLIGNIQDLIKLYVARATFIDKYTALSEHPELFTEEAQKEIKHIMDLIQEKEVNTALDNLGDIESVSKLRKALNTIDDNIVDEVLKKYSERGEKEKGLVDEFNKVNDYGKSLIEALGVIPQEEGDLAASLYALIQSAFDSADSVNDLKSMLEEAKSHIPENVAKALDKIVNTASKNLKSKKAAGKKDTNKPKQKPKKAGFSVFDSSSDSEEEAAEGQEGVEGPDNKGKKPKKKANPTDNSEERSPEVSDIEEKSDDELREIAEGKIPANIPDKDKPKVQKLATAIVKNREIPDGDSQSEGTNSEDNNPKKEQESVGAYLRSWYHTKYRFDELKDRAIRRAERYDSPVVDALDELGAFDFVDEGNLGVLFNKDNHIPIHYIKSKDKRLRNIVVLAIEVTPEVESLVKVPNPIIAQNGKKYQAVGALSFPKDNQAAANGYNRVITGLSEEIDEYLEHNSEPDYFVSERQSNEIQHIYSGRMVKTTNHDAPRQKSLKELTTNPILGVYYGNSPIPRVPMLGSDEEVVPLNSNNANPRDGSVWLMSREADGRWYAKAVQVRRFTADEYDIDEHYDTPIMQAIIQDLRIIADPSKTDYDRAIAKYDLMNILYFPEGVNILFHGDSVSIQGFKNNIGEGLSIDEKIQALLEALQDESLNLRFQVDPNSLSERVYVKDLLDSDVLTTDLAMVHNVNASFDLKIPDAQGNLRDEEVNPTGHTGRKGINNTIAAVTVMVNGAKYSVTEGGVITDSAGNTITDQKSLDEITAVMKIQEGRLNPVEGNDRLYLSVYSTTGEQFGVSGNHIITGEKLAEMLERAKEKADKKERKQNLDKAFGAMEQASDDEFAAMGYEVEGAPEPQSKPAFNLGNVITERKTEPTSDYNVGDRVHYDTGNKEGNGEIVRISSSGKSFEVLEDGGRKVWYAASLLTKLEETDVDESLFNEPTGIEEEPTSAGIFAGRKFHKPSEPESQAEEEKDKPVKSKPKGPVAIGESFNEENTPSVKELNESKSNPDFKRLARANRKYLAELGFKSVQELEDFINDPNNKMPAIETIDSQDKFMNMLDIIANCRGKFLYNGKHENVPF